MASAVIGALRVNLGIDSAQFSKGLKKAESNLQKFGRLAKAGLAAAATGATAAAGGMALMVKNTLSTADQLAKTSDKIGIAVEDLQRLRHAAELSGVSTKTLDMAMQRFSRRVAEAAAGGGELKDTLEQYGIAVRDSSGNMRSQVDILRDLSNVMENAESDQERLRIAFKAFDSEGAALVNTLSDGEAGLNRMMREADQLGIVISEKTARSAEKFNDNMTRLKGTFSAVGNTITADLAPHLVEFSDWLVKNGPTIREWAVSIAGVFIQFGKDLARLKTEIDAIATAFRNLRDKATANMQEFKDRVSAVATGIVEIFKAIPGQMAEIGRDIMAGLWQGIKGHWESVKGSVSGIASGIADRFKSTLGIQSPSKVMAEVGQNIMQGLGNGMKSLSGDVTGIAGNIANTVANAFTGIVTGAQNVEDVLKSLLDQLISMFANQAFKMIFGSLFGGGGGGGPLTGFASGILSGGFAGLFANGGTLGAGQWGIAGEAGPEPVVGPAQIIPTSALNGGASTVTVRFVGEDGNEVGRTEAASGQSKNVDLALDQLVADKIATPGSATGRAISQRFGLKNALASR